MPQFKIIVHAEEHLHNAWEVEVEADDLDEAQDEAVRHIAVGLEVGHFELKSDGLIYKVKEAKAKPRISATVINSEPTDEEPELPVIIEGETIKFSKVSAVPGE